MIPGIILARLLNTQPAAAQAIRNVAQASAWLRLEEMVVYETKISSVVLACLHEHAPVSLIHAD